uniref:Uncharacterized protein n=1 Tax=Oncorhynchus kisutch TaxID=8019 RepID=A0A8C7LMS2_ONCKI
YGTFLGSFISALGTWDQHFTCISSVRCARVLVTGASTGIGEQVAYHYAKTGAQVVITARREYALQKVAANCTSLGAQKALYVTGDMSQSSDPERMVRMAVEQLVLCLLNFLSYVDMASAALPVLEQSAGSMIVVSSLLGEYTSHSLIQYRFTQICLVAKSLLAITEVFTLFYASSRGYTNTAYPANDAALHIIKAGATHQKESFYPGYIYFACFLQEHVCPQAKNSKAPFTGSAALPTFE